ncbi:MAG: class III poly(R)-hydroxyalkanoic acid synthase subunit PhaC [Deltaproteobacteria bacterium]|nr:class III poly(R)-hydroxyalkanoic acid synthase subunit PhaC [Candidatus Anaeroferrophillacea bacterium]
MSKPLFPVDELMESVLQYTRDMTARTSRARDILGENLETAIASTPYEVEYTEDRIKLKHYKPAGKPKCQHPLLIVYALINRETMLDLQPDRSVVNNLLANGIDLYIIDWGYPAPKDRFQGFDDHINGYMHNAVEYICNKHGIDQLNLMGVCMGGTMSLIYAALHPEKIKNLLLTVTPVDFATDTGLLHVWWGSRNFEVDRLVDLQGNVSGDFLNINFLLMNPARLMLDKYIGFLENVEKRDFVENFVRMEKWIFDSPDVPGEIFREFIRYCYQENRLIENRLEVGGQRVDLKNVTMPLLNMYGLFDHLVPPAACEKTAAAVGSTDTTDVPIKTGHIGIYVSSKSQQVFVPTICSWLMERDAVAEKTPPGTRRRPAGTPAKTRTRGTTGGRTAAKKEAPTPLKTAAKATVKTAAKNAASSPAGTETVTKTATETGTTATTETKPNVTSTTN